MDYQKLNDTGFDDSQTISQVDSQINEEGLQEQTRSGLATHIEGRAGHQQQGLLSLNLEEDGGHRDLFEKNTQEDIEHIDRMARIAQAAREAYGPVLPSPPNTDDEVRIHASEEEIDTTGMANITTRSRARKNLNNTSLQLRSTPRRSPVVEKLMQTLPSFNKGRINRKNNVSFLEIRQNQANIRIDNIKEGSQATQLETHDNNHNNYQYISDRETTAEQHMIQHMIREEERVSKAKSNSHRKQTTKKARYGNNNNNTIHNTHRMAGGDIALTQYSDLATPLDNSIITSSQATHMSVNAGLSQTINDDAYRYAINNSQIIAIPSAQVTEANVHNTLQALKHLNPIQRVIAKDTQIQTKQSGNTPRNQVEKVKIPKNNKRITQKQIDKIAKSLVTNTNVPICRETGIRRQPSSTIGRPVENPQNRNPEGTHNSNTNSVPEQGSRQSVMERVARNKRQDTETTSQTYRRTNNREQLVENTVNNQIIQNYNSEPNDTQSDDNNPITHEYVPYDNEAPENTRPLYQKPPPKPQEYYKQVKRRNYVEPDDYYDEYEGYDEISNDEYSIDSYCSSHDRQHRRRCRSPRRSPRRISYSPDRHHRHEHSRHRSRDRSRERRRRRRDDENRSREQARRRRRERREDRQYRHEHRR